VSGTSQALLWVLLRIAPMHDYRHDVLVRVY